MPVLSSRQICIHPNPDGIVCPDSQGHLERSIWDDQEDQQRVCGIFLARSGCDRGVPIKFLAQGNSSLGHGQLSHPTFAHAHHL